MQIVRYTTQDAEAWNAFIASSKNGTFLLDRHFMDYHSSRFCDASLLWKEKGKIIAVLPANYDEASRTLYSHQGLTYGGLIMSKKIAGKQVMDIFDTLIDYCKNELKAEHIIYKPIPYIYNKYVSEEDLYALFRHGARLASRGLSSCIDLQNRIPFTESRKSGLRKATDITIRETDEVESFWHILHEVLTTLHNTSPVHSPDEIRLLMNRFPQRVKLYGAYSPEGTLLAGSLVFDCDEVVHTQYMAASLEGKERGALDRLISTLITDTYRDRHYLDFGISTEQGGTILNEGLLFQKEGFGGRGVCYDSYELGVESFELGVLSWE